MKFAKCIVIFLSFSVIVLSAYSQSTLNQSGSQNRYVLHASLYKDTIWKIYATGKIDSFNLSFDHGTREGMGIGTTKPVPSPYNSNLAYIDSSNNLRLYNLTTGQSRQLTSVGQHEDEEFAYVKVLITGWSKNEQRILYHVLHGETHCDDCNRPNLKVRSVDYGFYIYDLASNKHHAIQLPAEYRGWINDDDILLKNYDAGNSTLLRFSTPDGHPTVITTIAGDIHPGVISSDGKWLAAVLYTWRKGQRQQSQIIKMDLNSGEVTKISPLGTFAEYQAPTFSPNMHHLAYVRMQLLPNKRGLYTLLIGEEQLFECNWLPRVNWIDNNHISIFCSNEVTVMNIQTKQEKIRKHL